MVCLVVSTSFFMLGVKVVQAVDPTGIVTYQGRILDGNGVPVADASLDMVFKLVSDSVGTACYWSDSSATCASQTAIAVTLTDGLFSVNLGDVGDGFAAAIPNSVFGDDTSVYLEVIIEGETLLPRKLITAAPYALNSQTLDGVDSTGFLAAGGDTATGIFDFTSSVFAGLLPFAFEGATSDAFETIFQITDPTLSDKTITFKDESGTVAYLSDLAGVGSKWTDSGAETYLTSLTDDLAVGGTAPASSPFGVDEGANSIYVGEGATANGNIIFKASDADTGTLTYTTSDTFAFTGGGASFSGSVTANDYVCTTGNCIDFTELENILDLDASLLVNQGSNTWTQSFTGTTITGTSYVANALTTGTAFSVSSTSSNLSDAILLDADHSTTYTVPVSIGAPVADFSRTLISDTGGDVEVTEPVVRISNNVSAINAGVLSGAGYLLKLDQNAASGLGALFIIDDSTGASMSLTKTTDSTSIDIASVASSANIVDLGATGITSGNGMLITTDSSLSTGNAFKIDYETGTPTNDRLFQIESDCIGDATCSGTLDNNSVFRIMASGEAFSDVGFTAGGASTKYYDAIITSSSAFVYNSPTSFTWQDDGANTLATLTDAGTAGNFSVTNDITATNDLMVGGATPSTSPFGVDEGTDSVYIGEGSVANGNIIFKASDADTGTLTYTTSDTFAFTGGEATFSNSVTANDYACTAGDCIDFTELEDTLDLDSALTLNQGTNTWTQNFTGTTTNGLSYAANDVTSGNGMLITVDSSLTTGNAFKIDYEDAAPANDRLFQIESDCIGDSTCSVFSDDNSVFRIMASGEAFSDVGFTAGGASTKYYDAIITSSSAFVYNSPTSFTWQDDGANTLATLTDAGTAGNFSVTNNITATGDLAVNGGDITTTATTWNLDVGNTGTINFRDGANILASIIDNGTNGNFSVTNNITATGDFAVNGGDITTTATTWNLDVGNTGTVNFRDGTNSLLVIKDQGTIGDLEVTGDLFVDGDNVDSLGAPLVLNGVTGDEVRVGTGTPGVATGAGDFYVTSDLEVDATLSVGQHGAIGASAVANADVILGVSENISTGAGFVNKFGGQFKVTTSGTGAGTLFAGLDITAENTTTAGTIASMVGVLAVANENGVGSTVTSLIGLDAVAVENLGTATRAYGVRGTASGATSNYSGYFYGAAVQVDSTSTPTTPGLALGAGDLYVNNQFEIDGSGLTNVTVMSVRPATLNTGTGAEFIFDTLTTGTGLVVAKATDGATDFTNTTTGLVELSITEANATGNLLYISNFGTGFGQVINQVGDETALSITSTNTTDFIATFFADGGADTNDGISIQACLDLNPTTGCDLVKFFDGNGDIIGAIEGNGAGGVQLTSGGGADFAELFPGNLSSFTEGDLIGITSTGEVIVANDPNNIIGALSVARIVLGNATENWETAGTYVPVAMLGQVPVKVNSEGGPVMVGDYITLSSVAGVGKKSTGVGYVIGRALEDAVGNDTISVFVQPGWQAQGVLMASGAATEVLTDLEISGNVTIKNELDETTAQITDSGDIAISGNIYPSDRGTLQTEKYIYYDGSDGPGGDFMRTNASGWATGSYDFAEMFPASEALAPGEVVIFSSNNEAVSRSVGTPYDDRIAGIISTRPGFLAGDNRDGDVPVALAGRVPTYVSAENGNIVVGDPLTTSTRAGYAMKATEAGPIVGYAMEPFSGSTGVIIAVVRPSYYDGGPIASVPEVDTSASGIMTVAGLDVSGALNMNAGSINNVGSLSGIGGSWRLEENGDFITDGRLISVVKSYQNEDVETYAVTSRETTIQLSGTATLQAGSARVNFEEVDPGFNDVIADSVQYRVFLTPSAPTGQLFAVNRTLTGFDINDLASSNGVMVDWMVVAYHKDFAPESAPIVPATDAPVVEVVTPAVIDVSTLEVVSTDESVADPVIDPIIFEEPIADVTVVPEPDIIPEPTLEVISDPIAESVSEPMTITESPVVTDSTTTP